MPITAFEAQATQSETPLSETLQSETPQSLIALEDEYGAHNYHPLDVIITRAAGAWVTDTEGNRYLDFLAAYSAVNQGHCHPAILRALIEQAQKVTLTSRAFRNDQLPLLLRDLHDLTGFSMALPMNSGVEAVETALKAARKWGQPSRASPPAARDPRLRQQLPRPHHLRRRLLLRSPVQRRLRTLPPRLPPGPLRRRRRPPLTPSPPTPRLPRRTHPGRSRHHRSPPPATSPRPPDLREHNVLLICDEIQSGLGRTGTLFAFQHDGIRPDVCILGKALSGGFYPVSAVLASREILGVFRPGDHGSTFGGNPLACAVARAALQVLVDEDLPSRSAELGAYALNRLQSSAARHLVAVRGKGLWIGIELNVPARPLCEALSNRGVLCKETHDTVIRLAPPLIITRDDLAWGLDQIEDVLTA